MPLDLEDLRTIREHLLSGAESLALHLRDVALEVAASNLEETRGITVSQPYKLAGGRAVLTLTLDLNPKDDSE